VSTRTDCAAGMGQRPRMNSEVTRQVRQASNLHPAVVEHSARCPSTSSRCAVSFAVNAIWRRSAERVTPYNKGGVALVALQQAIETLLASLSAYFSATDRLPFRPPHKLCETASLLFSVIT
jgi:hypothetical protein